MINTIYICSRCGCESNIEMKTFRCQFGRPLGHNNPLIDFITDHLCRKCESDWCVKFFNDMINWKEELEQ